jgi:hypothetical protein
MDLSKGRNMKRFLYYIIMGLMLLIPAWVAGQDDGQTDKEEIPIDPYRKESRSDDFWSIQVENDFFTQSGDRYYTNGIELSWMIVGEPPAWLRGLSMIFPAYRRGRGVNAVNYTIGHKMFTPEDVYAYNLVEDEQPYAGYLYTSFTLLSHITGGMVDEGAALEFTFGLVGPGAGGEEVQKSYHDLIGVEQSNGWDNQLENELVLGVSYSRMWRIIQPIAGSFQFGITPHMTLAGGNAYTFGAGGVMFRIGTHLDTDIGPPTIKPGFPGGAYFGGEHKANWYIYMGTESRIVGRNLFLDGNTFVDSHSVEKEYIVGDLQFGLVIHFARVRLSVSSMFRTKEYAGQGAESHYGAINLSFRF